MYEKNNKIINAYPGFQYDCGLLDYYWQYTVAN